MRFHDRADELEALERRWRSGRAEYVVLYGRRRIGKTELILRFGEGRRCLYFEASTGTERDHLEDLSTALAERSERALHAAQPLASWSAFFAAIGEELRSGPLLIALDEFQFIARQTPTIGSLLNRFWREHRADPNLFLILSGSDVSFFEREVVGYAATTYGRRTGSMRLTPFPFGEVAAFVPRWNARETIAAYAVFGGVPYYLDALDPQASLTENVLRAVLAPDGMLRQEPRFLFAQQTDLRDESVYFSIMRAIAAGRTRRSEIADRIGRADSATGQLLDRLIEMGLIRRLHPVTVANPDRSRLVRFAIDDHFLRFWFTFVHPYESRLHRLADAHAHLKTIVLPRLDEFVSRPAFEQICHDWLLHRTGAAAVGWWWGNVKEQGERGPRNVRRELDVLAVDEDRVPIALGSCKWTSRATDDGDASALAEMGDRLLPCGPAPALHLFSRSGFTAKLRRRAEGEPRLHLVSVEDLLERR